VEGQEADRSLATVAALRLTLAAETTFDVHKGDSLRADAYRRSTAAAVVCNPPFSDRNWGQEELAHDARWVYGVPARLESELAWVQHALAHAVPGGSVVMLMPPASASRPSGRRIRAELVRRGALRAVISLPPRLAAHYAIPLQIWVLQQPSGKTPPSHVLVVDVSGFTADQTRPGSATAPTWDAIRNHVVSAWTSFNADPASVASTSEVALAVPVMDLLDDETDLAPSKYLLSARATSVSPSELASQHAQMTTVLEDLSRLLSGLPTVELPVSGPADEPSLADLAEKDAVSIRRVTTRSATGQEEQPISMLRGRILTGSDLARAMPPSEVGEVIADELRNPSIREGDVLVPTVGRRLTARVATGQDVGAYLSPTVVLIRPDPVMIDPWYLAGRLSSSGGGRQAARMASTMSGSIRFDPRRVRIPLLPIEVQRQQGEIFRSLWEFARSLRAAHDQGLDFIHNMIDVITAPATTPERRQADASISLT
jgi:hypothetical protein